VVAAVRRLSGTRRVGHAGTLDPFASGLLAVLIGRATRLVPFLVGLPKRYAGTIRLGVVTDTDDRDGTITRDDPSWQTVDAPALDAAMAALTGPQRQQPPVYSAKKVGGVPAYRRVRRGQSVSLTPREVDVSRFARVGWAGPDVDFVADVSSGTYIRALARDLGDALGCGAHLTRLRRTGIGPWEVGEGVPLAALATPLPLRPPRDAVAHLPQRRLTAPELEAVGHGRAVPDGERQDAAVALLDGDVLVAIARPERDQLRPSVVLVG